MQQWAELAQLELEGGDHAEVRTGATDPPEELGSSDELTRTVRPSAVTSSTARRLSMVRPKCRWRRPIPPPSVRPTDTRVTDHADRTHKAVCLRGQVELAQQRAALHVGDPPLGVDGHPTEPGEVDDQPAVGGRVTRGAVATGADGELQATIAPEPDRRRDVLDAGRANDDGRPAVEHGVPHAARVVVCVVPRADDHRHRTTCEGDPRVRASAEPACSAMTLVLPPSIGAGS